MSSRGVVLSREIGFRRIYQEVIVSGVMFFAGDLQAAALDGGAVTAVMALVPVFTKLLLIPVQGEVLSFFRTVAIILVAPRVMLTTQPRTPTASIKPPNRRYHQ